MAGAERFQVAVNRAKGPTWVAGLVGCVFVWWGGGGYLTSLFHHPIVSLVYIS